MRALPFLVLFACEPAVEASPPAADADVEPRADAAPTTAALVDQLAVCTGSACPARAALLARGSAATLPVFALATDRSRSSAARARAVDLLAEAKAKGVALRLHALARETEEFPLRRRLYTAVAATGAGDEKVFAALRADLQAQPDAAGRALVVGALSAFPEASRDWALKVFGQEPALERPLADLFAAVATDADRPAVHRLLEKATQPLARHRLAALAITLGDATRYPPLVEGLGAEQSHVRADAAALLAPLAEGLPDALRAPTIEKLQAARAAGRGSVNAAGFDRALKALGAPMKPMEVKR